MSTKRGRPQPSSGLQKFPRVPPLEAVRLKVSQLETARPRLRASDLNSSTPTDAFIRDFAEFGTLVRETYKLLFEVPEFVEWWEGRNTVQQPVTMTDDERWRVTLVIDAANEANHRRLVLHATSALSHRHEFILHDRREPVVPVCDRVFGLMKEGFRIADGRPVV